MRRRAFTLIELLVVIAIIAILAAILFPVFAQAREKGRQAACLSNTKQIATAVSMYIDDADEWLPFAANYWGPPAVYNVGGATYNSAPYGLVTPPVYLAPYVKNFQVFNCPSTATKVLTSGAMSYSTSNQSYGWNWKLTYIPGSAPGTVATGRTGTVYQSLKLAQIATPSDLVLMGDSNPARLSGAYIYPETLANTRSLSPPYDGKILRHHGGDNYIFSDGHAKWFKGESIRDKVWFIDGRTAVQANVP